MSEIFNLSQICPKLKPCTLFEGERNIIVEGNGSKGQVVLPKNYRPILGLLDGKHSIKDISSELFQKEGYVSFQAIITTVKLLSEAGLFENKGLAEHFSTLEEEKAPHEQKASLLNQTIYELPVLKKVNLNIKNELAFWALAIFMTFFALWNFKTFFNFDLSLFLKTRSGYESALLRLLITASVLMSFKALAQALLLFLSTGSIYGVNVRFFPYSIALGTNDSSIYSHEKKSVIIAYGVVSSWLYLVACATLIFIPQLQPYKNDFIVMSFLLTFIDMDPYRRSDLTKLFFFLYAEAQLKNILPYLKNCTLAGLWKDTDAKVSDELRYIIYSVTALGWAIGFLIFNFEIVLKTFPHLFFQIQIGSTASKFSAFCILVTLLFISSYLFIDLANTIIKNILSPILVPYKKMRSKAKEYKGIEIQSINIEEHLKRNMFFKQLSNPALSFLIKNSKVLQLKKGDNLIIQGDHSRDVYFLLNGSVNVNVRESTGRIKSLATLEAGTVLGEMALLEKCQRTANVTAIEDIIYLEFPEKVFAELMARDEFKSDYNKLLARIQLSQFVSSAKIFKDFPPEVMNLFVEAGDLVLFPAGHNIVTEGERDKTFFLLIKGKVDILKEHKKITELEQGDFFGEIALIANVPRTATVYVAEESLFLYIEDKKFWKLLSENIELAMYIESVSSHRKVNAA